MSAASNDMMRAAWYDRPGPAREVFELGELPMPRPATGEVLVHVKASGINPSDYKRRSNFADLGGAARMVPHSDGAGIVEQVGAGVPEAWIGKRVWLWNAVNRHGYAPSGPGETGTAAEYLTLPVENLAALPDGISFEVGACLGVPGFTAYSAVYADGDPRGKTILVQGGAGAVGELAVQLAVDAGATVIATVGTNDNADRAHAAGAHHVLNYRRQDVVGLVKAIAPKGVDQIIEVDFAANIQADSEMIAAYGLIVSYSSTSNPLPTLPYYALQFKGVRLRFLQIFTIPRVERDHAIKVITDSLAKEVLRPTIAALYELSDIAAAHEAAESRPKGQVVLESKTSGFLR